MKPNEIKILAVDDEPAMLEIIQLLFTKYGFSVETCMSGNQAWNLLKTKQFDLILTDVRMPDGDGIELAKKIREKHPNRPSVLFMTGYSDLLNEEIFHLGAEGKFTKPFDNTAVRSAIEACMLIPSVRWSKAPLPDPRRIHIQIRGESIEQLATDNIVHFGRGGFFVAYEKSLLEKSTVVSFHLKIEKPLAHTYKGHGIVKWSHQRSKNGIRAGLGIEIVHMLELEATKYHEKFKDITSFIPSPFK